MTVTILLDPLPQHDPFRFICSSPLAVALQSSDLGILETLSHHLLSRSEKYASDILHEHIA